jgi:hypothetical protein
MVTLLPDTAGQSIYLTLKEKNKYMDAYTDFLVVFKNMMSNESYYFIGNPATDNERYTKLNIGTNVDDALNGDIKIVATGQFWYTVYGQNSATNLDPNDASVVGVLEIGILHVLTEEDYFDNPNITIPNNIIYYE